jgi:hypothetical protein
MKSFAILALVFSLMLACGSSGSSNPDNGGSGDGGTHTGDGSIGSGDGGGGDDGGTILGDSMAPPGSYSVTFGPITVAAGQENTQCVVLRLHNPASMHVGSIHNVLSPNSHHMIVYRVSDTTEVTTPYDCQPFAGTLNPAMGSPLMISQKKDDLLTFPDGVAYTLAANQMLRLEMHYINPSQSPVTVQGVSTFIPIADAAFKFEADFLFIGDPDINIPAHATYTLGPIFIQMPSMYATSNFFAITGHEHKFGTNVVIATATSKTDPGSPIYDVPGWIWSEPKTVMTNPPFRIPANGGFKFTCDWNNTSSSAVSFGESANDEMCFFWAYYYPSQGAKVCVHTDQVPGGADVCCPGNAACASLGL